MNFFSRRTSENPSDLKPLSGFNPDMQREAYRLLLDLQEKGGLSGASEGMVNAKTFTEVVNTLSRAKIRNRVKRITSEVPKFD